MQYVRSLGGSVTKTWNSINPATLSGAIDVIVVQQDDGSLACSPFHVRFGKFSLLRPFEKKVDFKVNGVKQPYAMKLGEGGEAFFVFETSDDIPASQQTSPVVSPASSPPDLAFDHLEDTPNLQEPEYLDLNVPAESQAGMEIQGRETSTSWDNSVDTNRKIGDDRPHVGFFDHAQEVQPTSPSNSIFPSIKRSASEEILHSNPHVDCASDLEVRSRTTKTSPMLPHRSLDGPAAASFQRSNIPPLLPQSEAIARAKSLSGKLLSSNIASVITENGDLMLDLTVFKSNEEDALRAEIIARKVLAEEFEGNYDIGALIAADDRGNLWIYRSEEAKNEALKSLSLKGKPSTSPHDDATSDPGYQSDEDTDLSPDPLSALNPGNDLSVSSQNGLITPPDTPATDAIADGESPKTFAKTLRLTSEQLTALQLRNGPNAISFSVNRATCQAYMYLWKDDAPIVISDIDGTITKSDALGHVLNMIGRDWTHLGVAKLYTDIVANGYHILYLTSRSVGQADTTRTYLNGVTQEGFKLPRGPVILSPDRTMAALRREIYYRRPEVFKMRCLRDIRNLFSPERSPFYAGFGNRLTDALSYRTVNIPSTRIFTINTDAEVSLDLLSFNKYKSSYVTMREIVDHFFPPIGLLVAVGGEDYTDFNYWRDLPAGIEHYLSSDDDFEDGHEDDHEDGDNNDRDSTPEDRKRSHDDMSDERSIRSEDEGSDASTSELRDEMGESFMSQASDQEREALASAEAAPM